MDQLQKIMIIGSGPIVIGQACEFDYSGTQACQVLRQKGFDVILVNSNPATIMTDPEIASKVYIEPLKVEFLEKIIEIEKPQALIPTLGGQTALNLALELHEKGVLKRHQVQLLGADPKVIRAAEDREIFRGLLNQVGAQYPKSQMVRTFEEGLQTGDQLGYPLILRPNYTLGGGGGGVAYNRDEYAQLLTLALRESPTSEVLVEESILGWKEFELEVMRDCAGTFVVVCSIENFDPCGVHTGDSITIAPQQTLSDRQYQEMRDEACRILNAVGVETGGANIQFAVHPVSGARVVIEMNPRVSRSSALASKATGFPIAKIAALLAVGYRLDEITNDITRVTPCCFEPALDYVVTKIPRFAFEKFLGARDVLSTQMKSVGEVMALGRTLAESLMKACLSLELSAEGIPELPLDLNLLSRPNSQRLWHLFQAFREGYTVSELQRLTQIDSYFLEQIDQIVELEKELRQIPKIVRDMVNSRDLWTVEEKRSVHQLLLTAKRRGFSDARIARIWQMQRRDVQAIRRYLEISPSYFQVDTCAGEFASSTPYFYSTYWSRAGNPSLQSLKRPVAVLGSGPNRIGQGIEFDYSCVRGVKALRKQGHQVLMLNSNPETVSTDYDTADVLFFEPLSVEHVSEALRASACQSFVAQLGGQTPINLSQSLVEQGFEILGSSLEAMDLAEDRARFAQLCQDLGLRVPASAVVSSLSEAEKAAQNIGFPLIARPSYVLGGRRMEVLESQAELINYFHRHSDFISQDRPCFMDQFLEGALEVDVDLVAGENETVLCGIIEHIEAAGVHSGDSMGVLPPQRLKPETEREIERLSRDLALRLGIRGHLNLQLAIRKDQVFVLEANPRSSRSVPFVAKATGIPVVDLAVRAMLGKPLEWSGRSWREADLIAVKGVVFPFRKFKEADSILGPEMKSTGESMGRGQTYGEALMKAMLSSHLSLPSRGEVFFSLKESDKPKML
ncbi:MAG: carbamoyl-phosphate synthase large subunit, partial [Bdellovibrio sp.]